MYCYVSILNQKTIKQLLLLTTLITITSSSFSQLNKNQFLVGGNISFSSSKYGDIDTYGSKENFLEISPNAGYFIFDKLAAGGKFGYSYYKSERRSGDFYKFTGNSLNLSPYIRYYALPKKYKVNLYGQVTYDYIKSKGKTYNDSDPPSSLTLTEDDFSFMADPVFFLNPYIALELSLSYSTYKPEDDYRSSGFMTGLGFQIHLGEKEKK